MVRKRSRGGRIGVREREINKSSANSQMGSGSLMSGSSDVLMFWCLMSDVCCLMSV